MIRIRCPFCGLRDEAEFSYEGNADERRPPLDASEAEWHAAVFLRAQPKGRTRELWRHVHGCRAWVAIERDNVTHEVFSSDYAHPGLAKAMKEDGA